MEKSESKILVFIEGTVPLAEEIALALRVGSKCFRTLLGVSDMSFIEAHKGAVALDMTKLPKGATPLDEKPPVATPPTLRPGLTPPLKLGIPGVTAEA